MLRTGLRTPLDPLEEGVYCVCNMPTVGGILVRTRCGYTKFFLVLK
jgi:hypothetical protein